MIIEKGKSYKCHYWRFGEIQFQVQDVRAGTETLKVKVINSGWQSVYIKKATYKINDFVILIKSKIKNLVEIC